MSRLYIGQYCIYVKTVLYLYQYCTEYYIYVNTVLSTVFMYFVNVNTVLYSIQDWVVVMSKLY